MFDGNHRVRRDINLSGNRRHRRPRLEQNTNIATGVEDQKALVLEQSRQLREERRLQQLRQKSACRIQSKWRSWSCRIRLMHELLHEDRSLSTLELSMLLSLTTDEKVIAVLQRYAHASPSDISIVSKQRILQACFRLPLDTEFPLALVTHLMEEDPLPVSLQTLIVLLERFQRTKDTDLSRLLWKWAEMITGRLQSSLARSYMAAFLLLRPMDDVSVSEKDLERSLLPALAQHVDEVTPLLNTNILQVLQRILNCRDTHYLLPLLDRLLPDSVLLLTICHIRGEDIRSTVLLGKEDTALVKAEVVDDDESDENSSPEPIAASAKGTNTTTTRLSRQQVQTVPRLHQLYHDSLLQWRKWTLGSLQNPQESVAVAQRLGNATLWQQWGLATQNDKTTRRAYLNLLAKLLKGCSGWRTMATSPFLSQLAFSRPFLEFLWNDTQIFGNEDDLSILSMIVFCDVFAHHLIALSDHDFLQYYTSNAMGATPLIHAETIALQLKTKLYDLYWNKPVLASDVGVPKLRLFLSGTKLWNSLYERWSRLIRQAPWPESTWWFPRLATRDDDHAVISSREASVENDVMDIVRDDDEDRQDGPQDELADAFRDPKMARVLTCVPQALPFDRRVKLFSSLLNADKLKTQDESAEFRRAVARMMQDEDVMNLVGGRERVEIRRDALYTDSMNQLNQLGRRLKSKVQVTMINRYGQQEAGIDGGGVFKEFLDDLIKEAFSPHRENARIPQLFTVTPLQTLAVNMEAAYQKDMLRHYEFLGRVLGKAVYESILVEPQFCLPFLNQLLGKLNSLEDLKNFDREFYNNLVKLRFLSESEIANLGLTFELNVSSNRAVPLIPGGASMPVSKQNVIHYIHLVAHQRLNIEGAAQTKAFLRGFRDLIPASWVRLFSAYELQKLISGDDTVRGIDVANLKESMQYAGGYHPSQQIIHWFWEVIEEFTPDQQRQFLRFMTSCSRQPLLGFRALEPAPCIQQVRLPPDLDEEERKRAPLPSSSTCMNLLKLPNYKDKEILRKKLLDAVEAGAGFELT